MPKRGPYRKGEAKRAEILTAALEVFAEEGYRGTSLRKVAQRCELSLPGLMHYFDSKEDLLVQVLRRRDETEKDRHPEVLTVDDAFEIARAGMRTPGLVELFVAMAASAGDPDHPARAFFSDRYQELRPVVAESLSEATGTAAHSTVPAPAPIVPPERLAVLLLAVADGIQLQWLADRSVDMWQPVADLFRLVGLNPPPE